MKIFPVTLALCGASFCAHAQQPVADPNQQCQKVFEASLSAFIAKDNGYSSQDLLAAIPSKEKLKELNTKATLSSKIVLLSMHEIVDEIYAHPKLDPYAYSAFKSENCRRVLIEEKPVIDFSSSLDSLGSCVDSLTNDEKIRCGMKAAGVQIDQ